MYLKPRKVYKTLNQSLATTPALPAKGTLNPRGVEKRSEKLSDRKVLFAP